MVYTYTVTNENMAVTSPRLVVLLVQAAELSDAPMHRRRRMMTIPGVTNQTDSVSAGG